MKILLLFDLSVQLHADEYKDYMNTDDWQTERDIANTLRHLGHEVSLFGLYNNLNSLIESVALIQPDLVFNLSEAFRGDRRFEPHLASLLELLEVPYTGSGPEALHLCKDKGMAKKILSFHRIHVPDFIISRKSRPIRGLGDLKFPVFIKPLDLEGSEGISQLSFAENKKDALDRVKYLHSKFETDVIIEEYIDGRELYVGVLGNEKLQTFPARELKFNAVPDGEPKFASFRAKWDTEYRKKWGIRTEHAGLDAELEAHASELAKKIYRVLGITGYGRIDFRLTPDNKFVCLEANPNPSIENDSDYALSAKKAGMNYSDIVQKILNLGTGSVDSFDRSRSKTRKKKK